MRSWWKIVIGIACLAMVCAAAILWRGHRQKAVAQKNLAVLTRARADQGDAKAQSELASMYFYSRGVPQDYAAAVRWARKAADQNDAKAQDGLGYMYYSGQGVAQDYV